MERPRTHVRPRFSRGQEDPRDSAAKHAEPDFARGQSTVKTLGPRHKGYFGIGQAKKPHHPEWDYEGRFSKGQERLRS